MKIWAKLLPFIIVEWLAKNNLEHWYLHKDFQSVKVFDNVFLSWFKDD